MKSIQLKYIRWKYKLTLFDLSDLIYHVETHLSVSLTTSFMLYFLRVYKPTSYNSLKRTPLFISSSRIKTRIPVTVVDPAASTRLHIESKLRVQNRCTHSVDSYLNTLIWTADWGIKCLHNVNLHSRKRMYSGSAISRQNYQAPVDNKLSQYHHELTETCLDVMSRYTYGNYSAIPAR